MDSADDDPMHHLLGHSITYRIAVGPQQGRKVLTLQALSDCGADDPFARTPGNVAGFYFRTSDEENRCLIAAFSAEAPDAREPHR